MPARTARAEGCAHGRPRRAPGRCRRRGTPGRRSVRRVRPVLQRRRRHRDRFDEKRHRHEPFGKADAAHAAFVEEAKAHLARSVWANARGAAGRIVVGLVAGVLPEGIVRERDADIAEVREAPRGKRGLDERDVAVHGASLKIGAGHRDRRVGTLAAQAEFVVGLLVRARVDRGSSAEAFRENEHVLHALGLQARGGGKARRSAPDHQHITDFVLHSSLASAATAAAASCLRRCRSPGLSNRPGRRAGASRRRGRRPPARPSAPGARDPPRGGGRISRERGRSCRCG